MPAELTYREDGSAVVAVSETPAWHGEGHVKLGGRYTKDELRPLVPEWFAPVEARPMYATVNGQVVEIDTHVANVRTATTYQGQRVPERTVGVVGRRRYQLVQNEQAADLADAILRVREADTDANVASIGLLREGAVAFIALYLGEDYLVPGAESERRGRYLNIINSFDASYALTAVNSDIRILCANTLRMNLGLPRKVAIRHTGDMDSRLAHAREALQLADRYAQLQAIAAEHMVQAKASPADAEQFFAQLVPLPIDKETGKTATEGRALTNAKQMREVLANLYWENPTVAPVRGTKWGLMQTVTYYTNHGQARRATAASTKQDNRYEALVLDDSAPLESRAQRLLTDDKLAKALATA